MPAVVVATMIIIRREMQLEEGRDSGDGVS